MWVFIFLLSMGVASHWVKPCPLNNNFEIKFNNVFYQSEYRREEGIHFLSERGHGEGGIHDHGCVLSRGRGVIGAWFFKGRAWQGNDDNHASQTKDGS